MINNGIGIKVINNNKFKTICFAFLLRQPLDRKNVTLNNVICKILTMGCEKYKTKRKIDIKGEELYGSYIATNILKKGENQIIQILTEIIEDKVSLDEIFLFLKDIILNPLIEEDGFNKKYLEKAKELVKQDIYSRENDKKELAKDRCLEIMCENEKFGIMADGYIEDLENDKINSKNLYEHYKNILETGQIEILAIGNVEKEEIENLVKKYFVIENRKYKENKIDFVYKEKTDEKNVVEKFNITQGKLCMAFRTNIEAKDKAFIPLLVGNEILGGGAGSILFNNVREKESLCYYINSFIFIFKGILFVQSGVEFKNYEKVVKYIKESVEDVSQGKFDDSQLDTAISSLCKKYKSIVDYNTATIDYYYTNYLLNINMDIDSIIENIKNVKKEDIKKAFENIWLDTCYFMKGEEN